MRRLFLAALACGSLAFFGCAESVYEAADDVREAQHEAAENVADEQADVDEAQREGAANFREEQRELEEAVDEANRDGDPTTP